MYHCLTIDINENGAGRTSSPIQSLRRPNDYATADTNRGRTVCWMSETLEQVGL